jgi:hypothetical protein
MFHIVQWFYHFTSIECKGLSSQQYMIHFVETLKPQNTTLPDCVPRSNVFNKRSHIDRRVRNSPDLISPAISRASLDIQFKGWLRVHSAFLLGVDFNGIPSIIRERNISIGKGVDQVLIIQKRVSIVRYFQILFRSEGGC